MEPFNSAQKERFDDLISRIQGAGVSISTDVTKSYITIDVDDFTISAFSAPQALNILWIVLGTIRQLTPSEKE